MAYTWALNPENNDLIIGRDSKLVGIYGADEVRQRIIITLQHLYQEYFLNVPAGMPWYELILGSRDKQMVDSLIRRAVLGVPGVVGIVSYKLEVPSSSSPRNYAIYMTVEVYGQSGPNIIDLVASLRIE